MGHRSVVIKCRVVVDVLLDDGKDAGWRFPSLDTGRDWRAENPTVGVVKGNPLGFNGHDRHDRLAGVPRCRRLGGLYPLFRSDVDARCRQPGDSPYRQDDRDPARPNK